MTILIPVFNEEDNISHCYETLNSLISSDPILMNYDFEILFTDNCSTDKTFQMISDLKKKDSRIRCLRYSKNFGFQNSIFFGYLNSKGDGVVQLDVDLQDPPRLIADFVKKWEEGYLFVYGIRKKRQEFFLMNWARKIFYRFVKLISHEDIPLDAGEFRLIDKKIVNVLKQVEDQRPYLRGLIASIGFKRIGIEYDRDARIYGKTKFSFSALSSIGLDGIINFSVVPLRISVFFGLLVSGFSLLAFVGYFFDYLFNSTEWPKGFPTIVLLLLINLGVLSMFIGIIGEYVGRIYMQSKKYPVAIVDEEIE